MRNIQLSKSGFVVISITILSFNLMAQSPNYTIESFQGNYSELSNYQSVAILTKGDLLWEFEFQLNFPFPFYDSTYTRILFNHASWGSFTEDQDEALLLMDDLNSYTFDNVLDTSNITSDVRFAHKIIAGMQSFVIQFTKVRFFADPYKDSLDTYLNYQLIFYENGVIEVHFGDMSIDDSPIYGPGEGFYCYTTAGGVNYDEVCGPHMGISNPYNEDDAIGLEGAYDDYEIIGDNYSDLTVIPPRGWVIRFKPVTVATSEPSIDKFIVNPNPTSSYIDIGCDDCHVGIYDTAGRLLYDKINVGQIIDVSFLPSGIYSLQLSVDKYTTFGRFIKL